ncbi:hypothetical protein AAFC00_003899 [Neodothiora populina]|uniref:Uncharacterized protein n=1 Tax=Neodothiora populina TaxID=2781224 RepID=A0ABR3PFT2_9PEZI
MAEITITNVPTATAAGTAVTPTDISIGGGDSSSSTTHHSYWDLHKRWIAMVIVLFIGFILIFAIGIYLHRRYRRKQDKITEGFNAGITQRSAPMTQSPGPQLYRNHDGANDSASLASSDPYGRYHQQQYGGSARQMSVVRERNALDRTDSDVIRDLNEARGGTPAAHDLESGRTKLKKGKARTEVSEMPPQSP